MDASVETEMPDVIMILKSLAAGFQRKQYWPPLRQVAERSDGSVLLWTDSSVSTD